MANSNKFRAAINSISSNGDDGTQNYVAAFLQYGVITNLVLFHIKSFTSNLNRGVFDDFLDPYAARVLGFDSYEEALQTAMKRLPESMFSGEMELTAGDLGMAAVTIGCALGLAWVIEMERTGTFDKITNDIAQLQNDFNNGLNLDSLLESYQEFKETARSLRTQQDQ